MSAVKSTVYMASMTSASVATLSEFGKNSRMFSTACQSPHLSMTKSFACTAVSLPNSLLWLSYNRSQDQQKCLRTVFSATYSGLTQKKVSQVGVKTTAVSLILSEKPLLSSSSKKTILTSFAERIKSWKMGTSSSADGNS